MTRGVKKLLARQETGQILVLTFTGETEAPKVYRLHPSNRVVRADVADRAIREHRIRPGGDSLFADALAQTWRAPS
ncbi:hypothetical protein [Methylobacterium nonmethylotrophicum]|uniref:Uncharacterized protein n=1 Tax=Methylobacterium nonmethylotrophicum TaxID=1141884 RepID=A0A4Z0NNP7_9HYPH|nr:hypothetical protein [Methylobacterium nonmethylotrophicum]TGD98084.1 hypothetical protein EU555_18235 [Methylobacterium nonmethylotrophicum]